MTVQVFDPLKHHVGLGLDAASLNGLLLVGTHQKQLAAPLFDRPSNAGDGDLIGQRGYSTWTVTDFTGGEFQRDWDDDAMFDECVSMIPNQLTRAIRTMRPLEDARLGDIAADGTDPISLDVIDNFIFLVFNNATPQGQVLRFNPSNPNAAGEAGMEQEAVPSADTGAGNSVICARWNANGNRLWLGTNKPNVLIYEWLQGQSAGNRLSKTNELNAPTLANDPVVQINGIHLFGAMKFAITGHGAGNFDNNRVWLHVSGSGTDTKWKQVGTLPGSYVTSVTYNNAVYILTRTGSNSTQLSMTQGDQLFPVLDLPYFYRGQSMVEYAGRLFIAGVGNDLDGNDSHGEIYEVNGTSLRLVRTFAAEAQRTTAVQIPGKMAAPNHNPATQPIYRKRLMTYMKCLQVAEGLLWFPDSSWTGLECYDAASDAFFGGPRYRHGDVADLEFTHMVTFGDSIYLYGVTNDSATSGLYRTERKSDAGDDYEAYLVTSDFHPEPGRPKVWSRFATLTQNGAPELAYSTDSGATWTDLTVTEDSTFGDRHERAWDLSSVPESKVIRFKITFPLSGAADVNASELVSHSLSFLVRGDGKKRWQMTVNCSEHVETLDQRVQDQDPSALAAELWNLQASSSPLTYRDVDGTDYKVIVSEVTTTRTVIDATAEGFCQLVLLEV